LLVETHRLLTIFSSCLRRASRDKSDLDEKQPHLSIIELRPVSRPRMI